MKLHSIFSKPVDRTIEGVIKADDEESLRIEAEEYVLTNEVSKRIEAFLDAYNNYEGANGVWISGFFGSGKSHLLKMLALLLKNRSIDDVPVLDIFLDKKEIQDNEILQGDLKKAVAVPSESILFNIDQKADVISKSEIDALLAVFVKVFDEMCGYYGKHGHIAQFERDLDSRGIYEKFKDEYQALSGKAWTIGREQALLEAGDIAGAYAEASGEPKDSAVGILDKYRSQYKVSIEDFANQISDYINRQVPEFRLNFFVDEVGQYIAENVKLMTNLQTIAESLATKCRGRAWIIVTAQEDMSSVFGDSGKQQSNDFSKIQARFANRMKLTSADVAEVIQKRLLRKNQSGMEQLNTIYHAQSNNFKTLFDFADGSQTYRNFKDRDHFIRSYPFIPYQFTLFQAAIQNLSEHNCFEGKHSSVGERSMLGVFQQVAVHIANHEVGQLATFDLMFEGIRTAMKANIQRAILTAEGNLDNPFAILVLKALFLVKYVKEFKATVRNLSVLMLDSFDKDLPELGRNVEEALNLLEQQTYIQRNGDEYEFLTDEEKDVEHEIKNTEVESSDIADELSKIIFDHIIKNRKIRYNENGQDYPFTKKLDDKLMGREHELSIHIVSPFHENSGNEQIIRMQSMGRDELVVIMPPDDRLIRDLMMYKQTAKYIQQNISVTQQEAVKRILTDKSFQNRERLSELQKSVKRLLGSSQLIVRGGEVEIAGEDPQTRITRGFHELIHRTYTNLRMLRGINYTENDIAICLQQASDGLYGGDTTTLAESEQEMLSFIVANNRSGVRTTLKSLVEKFECKPYGWYYAAILCTLAKLCARGKTEVRSDGNILEDADLERSLRNTHGHPNVVLEPQIDFTISQVRQLKKFYEDFFDGPPTSGEAKALGKETATKFNELLQELKPLAGQSDRYPFLSALDQPLVKMKELSGKPYTFYLTELSQNEDELLDMKENTLDPIRRFMSGALKGLYDESRGFIQTQEPNFPYIEGNEVQQIQEMLKDPECYKGNRMQQAKTLLDGLKAKLEAQLEQEKITARESVSVLKNRVIDMDECARLSNDQKAEILKPFDEYLQSLDRQTLIAVIRDTLRRFEDDEYQRILTRLSAGVQTGSSGGARSGDEDQSTSTPSEPAVEYLSYRSINIPFDKAWLADEEDVDRYLASVREAIVEAIRNGKRIQI